MLKRKKNVELKSLAISAAIVAASAVSASATIVTVYDGIAAGKASFDSTATSAGATVTTDVWSGLSAGTSIDRGDYTITANDGGAMSIETYGTLSGEAIGINPDGTGPGIGAFGSGVTLTFDNAVNAFGFEVGDWATCCYLPTNLYISFDDGAPILVGSATGASEGLFPSQDDPTNTVFEIFVAAFDDTGSFTKVSFWGDGFGEYLVAGGSVKYALLDEGTLPPSEVPLPASGLLLVAGLGALAARRKSKKA